MSDQSSEKSRVIQSILSVVGSLLPAGLSENIRANFLATFRAALDNMEIVTRSEMEVQEAVLQRAREKIIDLEARIEELESR